MNIVISRVLKFLACVAIVAIAMNSVTCSAQSNSTNLSRGIIRCPVIGDLQTGYFSASPRKYACFRTARHAKRYGLMKFNINQQGTVTCTTSTPIPNGTPSANPHPTATPVSTPLIPPTAVPSQKSFSMQGKGSSTSQIFTISELPAQVAFKTSGAPSDRFQIILRDASAGYYLSQLVFGQAVLNNTAVITKKGTVYLEIKATDGMSWAITASYK